MHADLPTTLRVLFIGNSFTARNNVPGLIARLAAAQGLSLDHRLISAGGASLRAHWNQGEAAEAIRGGHYDYVVLQEQSTLPVKNRTRMHENIRLFDEVIRAAGSRPGSQTGGSRTALYLTWARRHAPGTQAAITEAYTSIAHEIGATLVPVGLAWQRFLLEHSQPPLHDKDHSHPTLAGSYLAACVFFAVLFERSPAGPGLDIDVPGLAPADARLLRAAAQAVVPGRAPA